jgi:hypothetical protein
MVGALVKSVVCFFLEKEAVEISRVYVILKCTMELNEIGFSRSEVDELLVL